MKVKCHVKECIHNQENTCNKDEIEIMAVSAYDDSAECLSYEKEDKE